MNQRINQIELISAIAAEIERQVPGAQMTARQANAMIAAADAVVAAMDMTDDMPAPGCGIERWLASDAVGRSSEYLARTLHGAVGLQPYHPYDAEDWWRCCNMLACVADSRARLQHFRSAIAAANPVWCWIVTKWEYLEWLLAVDPHRCSAEIWQAVQEARR